MKATSLFILSAAVVAALAATPAMARSDTHIHIGFYSPAPVYYEPAPVYYAPSAPVYYAPPVAYYPPVQHVYYAPPRPLCPPRFVHGYGYRHGYAMAWNEPRFDYDHDDDSGRGEWYH